MIYAIYINGVYKRCSQCIASIRCSPYQWQGTRGFGQSTYDDLKDMED